MSTLDAIATAAQWTAVTALFAAAWYRRHSWSYRWEQPITLHLILLGVGLTLTGHLLAPRGTLPQCIYANSLDTYIGDVMILLAFAVLASNMLTRVSDDDTEAQQLIKQRVMPIVTAAPALMLATLTLGNPTLSTDSDDLLAAKFDGWMVAYWCILFTSIGACAAMSSWALRIIAEDEKQRAGAHTWQLAMQFTLAACAAGIANAFIAMPIGWLVWVLGLAASATAAAAATMSWRRRMQPFRLLMHFMHTTRRELRDNDIEQPRHPEGDTPEPAV